MYVLLIVAIVCSIKIVHLLPDICKLGCRLCLTYAHPCTGLSKAAGMDVIRLS